MAKILRVTEFTWPASRRTRSPFEDLPATMKIILGIVKYPVEFYKYFIIMKPTSKTTKTKSTFLAADFVTLLEPDEVYDLVLSMPDEGVLFTWSGPPSDSTDPMVIRQILSLRGLGDLPFKPEELCVSTEPFGRHLKKNQTVTKLYPGRKYFLLEK
jgi:hypothetical protein